MIPTRPHFRRTRRPRRVTRGLAAFALGLLASLSVLPHVARAENRAEASASFDRAQAAFADRRFDDAERELEWIVRDEGFAPGVLLNLGNARLEQGELGHAIVAYERARLLDPNDPAIARNLRLARERAELATPAESRAEVLASMLPARRWLTIGAGALLSFALACVGAGVLRRGRWAATGLGVASGAVVAACAAALWIGTFGVERAIVVEGPVTARVSPFAEAEAVFDVREGESLDAIGTHGEFVRVRRADESGWVPARSVESVLPRGS